MIKHMTVLIIIVGLKGCAKDTSTTQGELVTRVGFLPERVGQHPIVTNRLERTHNEFYFDVGDHAELKRQIIIVHPIHMSIPTRTGRKIELTGTIKPISLEGGKVGKAGYRNEILTLHHWKYLD